MGEPRKHSCKPTVKKATEASSKGGATWNGRLDDERCKQDEEDSENRRLAMAALIRLLIETWDERKGFDI